jgi:hypothetical protein
MDIVNMSLGSAFGSGSDQDPEIDAANNAVEAGTLIVASAGNDGPVQYVHGRPASASRVLSVAAFDTNKEFPGASLNLSTGTSVDAINANGAPLPGGSFRIKVLKDAGGNVSLGCDPAEYAGTAGMVVVSRRGTCDRVQRAKNAQAAGSAAAVMINNAAGFPPFEGPIAGVTIPFLGVRQGDGPALVAADGGTTTITAKQLTNPDFTDLASFTSSGPRFDDNFLKPEVAAPGVSIVSTGSGTGNGAAAISGTSMASPHVAGLAALVNQSHPSWWSPEDLKQAIINTSSPSAVGNYADIAGGGGVRRAGAGLVQAPAATKTVAVAFGRSDKSSLSFGFDYDFHDMSHTGLLLVRNHGATPITFNLSTEFAQGRPHSVSFERTTLVVPAWGHASVNVTLRVPIATVGNADAFREVGGVVTLTPTGGGNSGISLHVPYYLVPRALSNIKASLTAPLSPSRPNSSVRLTNSGGGIAGTADFYAWGQVTDGSVSRDGRPFELRASGVQSFNDGTDQIVIFALSTKGRYTTAAPYEFDVLVQVGSGPSAKFYQVFSFDLGAVTAGAVNGQVGSFVFDFQTGEISVEFLAVAPNNTSTILLPVLASQLGLTPANPRFLYQAFSFDAFSESDDPDYVLPGVGAFNAFNPAISNGDFVSVPVGGTATVPVSLNVTEAAITPAKGLMIVSVDNNADRGGQVTLLPVQMPAPSGGAGGGTATASAATPTSHPLQRALAARMGLPALDPQR